MKCANVVQVSELIFNDYLESLVEKLGLADCRKRSKKFPLSIHKKSMANRKVQNFRLLSPIQGSF